MQAAICQVPPDVELENLAGRVRLRQDLELDSLDFLHLVEIIAKTMGVDIPERDYPAVATVDGMVNYLASHGSR